MRVVGEDVFSCDLPLEKLLVSAHVERKCSGYTVVGSSGRDVLVWRVRSGQRWSDAQLEFRVRLDGPVFELVCHENKVHAVVSAGRVFLLTEDGAVVQSSPEDDCDIFDVEEPSSSRHCSWKVEEVCSLPDSCLVLSACSSNLGICLVVKSGRCIELVVVDGRVTARCSLGEETAAGCRGCTCVVGISSLSFDLLNLWLPHVERAEEFLLVGLDGRLLCVPVALPLRSYLVYTSVHCIVSVSWFQDRKSDRFDCVVMTLESGAVVRLTPVSQEVSFPFFQFLSDAVILNNCILSLNERTTRILPLSDSLNCSQAFPVPCVSAACTVGQNSKTVLVCDTSHRLHLINLENIDFANRTSDVKSDARNSLPRASDLQALISSSVESRRIVETLKSQDEHLRAKSLIARRDVVESHLQVSARVVQAIGQLYTVRIKIGFSLPGVVFSAEFWKLSVTVDTVESVSTEACELRDSISREKSLVQLVNLRLHFHLLFDLKCRLISTAAPPLSLQLNSIQLDASHFLLPPSLKELCSISEPDRLVWAHEDSLFELKVPLVGQPPNSETFLKELIGKSSALWRYSEWNRMVRNDCVSCVLFGREVDIKIVDSSVSIVSEDLKACQALKLALLIKLDRCAAVAGNLMGWHQACNIVALSPQPNHHLNDLYNAIRTS